MWRTNVHSRRARTPRSRTQVKMKGAFLSVMFWFLAVIRFALQVFPYIPAAKGGGNYTESPVVRLVFRQPSIQAIDIHTNNAPMLALASSNCYVIIERTSCSLCLANTNDMGGPLDWLAMRKLPPVIEVRRDAVDHIVYTQVTDGRRLSQSL
jgi:hypothetical protein